MERGRIRHDVCPTPGPRVFIYYHDITSAMEVAKKSHYFLRRSVVPTGRKHNFTNTSGHGCYTQLPIKRSVRVRLASSDPYARNMFSRRGETYAFVSNTDRRKRYSGVIYYYNITSPGENHIISYNVPVRLFPSRSIARDLKMFTIRH